MFVVCSPGIPWCGLWAFCTTSPLLLHVLHIRSGTPCSCMCCSSSLLPRLSVANATFEMNYASVKHFGLSSCWHRIVNTDSINEGSTGPRNVEVNNYFSR